MVVGVRRARLWRVVAPCAVAVLALTACVPGDGGGGGVSTGGGESVPVGSPPEAYAAALADIEPITLNFGGFTTGPGEASTDAYVKYGDLVEEWSGGKIIFKYDYAGARVSLAEMADGLNQGRIDMGMYIPSYQPDDWPTANLVTGMSHFGQNNPVSGRLASFAAQVEFGQSWEPLQEEAGAHSILALYPLYSPVHDVKLQCVGPVPQSLADLKGKQVRVVDQAHSKVAEELGMVPVSLTTNELFQGLQRGVVDCAVNSLGAHHSGGYYDVVDSWTFGQGTGADWSDIPVGWGISERRWNELPLAARQLLWDAQPQMLEYAIEAGFTTMRTSMEVSHEAGMEFGAYEPEVTQVMRDSYAKADADTAALIEERGLAEDGEEVVQDYADLHDKWWEIVTEELGYEADTSWETYHEDFSEDMSEVDLAPFVERLYEEVLQANRPE